LKAQVVVGADDAIQPGSVEEQGVGIYVAIAGPCGQSLDQTVPDNQWPGTAERDLSRFVSPAAEARVVHENAHCQRRSACISIAGAMVQDRSTPAGTPVSDEPTARQSGTGALLVAQPGAASGGQVGTESAHVERRAAGVVLHSAARDVEVQGRPVRVPGGHL